MKPYTSVFSFWVCRIYDNFEYQQTRCTNSIDNTVTQSVSTNEHMVLTGALAGANSTVLSHK